MLKKLDTWIIGIILFSCSVNIFWGGNRWKGILGSSPDSKGYYAYLPAIFIYKDLHFTFEDSIENKYSDAKQIHDYRVHTESGTINKYYLGTALAELPFFLAADLIAKAFKFIDDGYSKTYALFLNLAGIFYTLLGLYYLRKTLKIYRLEDGIISFVLFLIVFGTQLFYYTVNEPGMSHCYSFGIICFLLYEMKKMFVQSKTKRIFLISVLLGLIILIRPVNILIVLVFPFLSGSWENFRNKLSLLLSSIKNWFLFLLPILIIPSLQLLMYKLQTGSFFQYSYGDEHFNWSNPEVLNTMISYKKGVFIYTPLILISMFGFIHFYKRNRYEFFTLLMFLTILIYVLSSWWCWWYGWGFSYRPLTEFLGIFCILLGVFINSLKIKSLRRVVSSALVLIALICQIQIYQYRHFVIHGEKMDKEHYWKVFIRVDQLIKNENPNSDLLVD